MTRRARQLREACRSLLRDLDFPPPLDIDDLLQQISRRRGRPVRPAARTIPADGPSGAVAAGPTADWLVYQQATSRPHRAHIIAHELAHLLADELASRAGLPPTPPAEPLRAAETSDGQLLLDGRDLVDGNKRTACYDELREADAETVASVLGEWASVLNAAAGAPSAGDARHLDSALTDSIGWWP